MNKAMARDSYTIGFVLQQILLHWLSCNASAASDEAHIVSRSCYSALAVIVSTCISTAIWRMAWLQNWWVLIVYHSKCHS